MDKQPAWKKHQTKKKWRSIISVFIFATLIFAIINGLVKGFTLGDKVAKSDWDTQSAYVAAVNTNNPAVFVFNKDLERAAVFTLGGNTLFETGDIKEPLGKISDNIENSGSKLSKNLQKAYGIKVQNYINFSQREEMNEENGQEIFENFTSIATPIKLLTAGWGKNVEGTNITRVDAFRLWWQLKGISVKELKLVDLTTYQEEIVNQNGRHVLGADTVSLNRVVAEYLQNFEIAQEKKNVRIVNSSGLGYAAGLAQSFARSVGVNVVGVEKSKQLQQQTQVFAENNNSYTAKYLAKVFDCAINDAQKDGLEDEITIVLGSDFVLRNIE